MPSPFPGMDPYLEAPDVWPDIHEHLASEIAAILNGKLPASYYARLEKRHELGIVDDPFPGKRIVPDLSVVRERRTRGGTGMAVADPLDEEASTHHEIVVFEDSVGHPYVEVRDARRSHELVTVIELLSPSNKRRGPDQEAYCRKRQEVWGAEVSWVEIDLLRSGDRLFHRPELESWFLDLDPPASYLVQVNRWWEREKTLLFPVGLRESLPSILVPLRSSEADVVLGLQRAFEGAYDRGPYRRGAVDYASPTEPPLSEADAAWARERLTAAGVL